ncbi:MAG: exodeoxyribonuclease VII large subunit [Tindallia sp. MSAO_Bac2]|nr:MAG: exodeoxyribonuclease VII large subunit [Tindallia sp. MSAO_Bac2]
MRIKTLSVSELNRYVKRLINADPILHRVSVAGEVTGFKAHSSGHIYFTLKDENSRLRCVMFRQHAMHLDVNVKDGMKIKVNGGISVYERDGQYQLYAETIEETGLGEYYIAFQKLKEKLEKQGLFDKDRKKKLPDYPERIGLITSSTGAALQDILKVLKKRWPIARLYLFPVQVQGEAAASELESAVNLAQGFELDVVILGRGGGAVEELWAFNDEALAYAIAGSKVPIITGIGHETDFTIADFVADYRAHTPTAAAEIAVPDIEELRERLDQHLRNMKRYTEQLLTNKKSELKAVSQRMPFRFPERMLEADLRALEQYKKSMIRSMTESISKEKLKLTGQGEKLDHLSPLSVMKRGYGVVQDSEGKTITSIHQLQLDELFKVSMQDGKLLAKLMNTEEGGLES